VVSMDRLSNGPFYNDGLARNSNTNNFPAGLIVNRNYPLDSRNRMTTPQIWRGFNLTKTRV
jgi:hypothetical protein